MPAVKKSIKNNKDYYGKTVIGNEVSDHGNDPFVVRKVEEAKEFLRKNGLKGLPDQLEK
ncbi:MAG TPA: hypothetical protein VGI43_02895 [Mucilaginibacter sp.]|jgi:hypothetical protein